MVFARLIAYLVYSVEVEIPVLAYLFLKAKSMTDYHIVLDDTGNSGIHQARSLC